MIIYMVILYLIGLCLAFQYITAFVFLVLGRNNFYARFVEKFYEHQPKDWYDKFMNFFYIMNYGVAHRGYVKVMEKHGGIKGKLRYAGLIFIATVILAIIGNIINAIEVRLTS
ncbi:Uncharacterised protein [Niallia circulans]|jgi:lipoprotein signal peptidase|uniref:hypothetical protein n=1 Tax=Shouchella clausii TaxID=79880 RepID=UPI000D8B5CCC|nr:hypothetical protein [Shouchella clausii]MCM3547673.1 hypothetical protein [Shouchella clausii]SPT80723.1 Uncharacterised protein [Niallia circulans]